MKRAILLAIALLGCGAAAPGEAPSRTIHITCPPGNELATLEVTCNSTELARGLLCGGWVELPPGQQCEVDDHAIPAGASEIEVTP